MLKIYLKRGWSLAKFQPKECYIILAESVPAGTTSAYATAKALGYSVDGFFSSSFRDAPTIKEKL